MPGQSGTWLVVIMSLSNSLDIPIHLEYLASNIHAVLYSSRNQPLQPKPLKKIPTSRKIKVHPSRLHRTFFQMAALESLWRFFGRVEPPPWTPMSRGMLTYSNLLLSSAGPLSAVERARFRRQGQIARPRSDGDLLCQATTRHQGQAARCCRPQRHPQAAILTSPSQPVGRLKP